MDRINRPNPFLFVLLFSFSWSSTIALGDETARYLVTFDATWSAETHPEDFPASAHFSGLIGGTHSDAVTFWEPGGMATPGIRNMAETGGRSPLNTEVQSAIDDSTAFSLISGRGVPRSPGDASVEFDIHKDFSLVTLVTMIAPSPDWFLGVSGYNLNPDGKWLGKTVIELEPYDAGTDSGARFTSGNSRTSPQVPIFHITETPFENTPPLGTYTFLRLIDGDYNETGTLDIEDINSLSSAIRAGSSNSRYDLDGNGVVDMQDRTSWIVDHFQTFHGDSNLDGLFDSNDLVTVFQAGEYEDQLVGNSTWETGDWDGDGDFSSSDLVVAFQDGGYEAGPRLATVAVPEPAAIPIVWLFLVGAAVIKVRRF